MPSRWLFQGSIRASRDLLWRARRQYRVQGSARGDGRDRGAAQERPMKPVVLHVAEDGRGDAVVLVHAIGCDLGMWDDVAPALAKRFRVVRVDVRGHGGSPVPPPPYALAGLADDVARVLDRLRIERAHWVGLSMGGMIGQAFALGHASRLGRLVLANTTSSYGADGRQMWEARARAVAEGGMAAI